MKIKSLLISLLLIKNCYADNSFPLWIIPIVTTTAPTAFPSMYTHELKNDYKEKKRKELFEFIKNSYDKLEIEIAKGEGPYLDKLIDLTSSTFDKKEEKINYYREELNKIISSIKNQSDRKEYKTSKLYEVAKNELEK